MLRFAARRRLALAQQGMSTKRPSTFHARGYQEACQREREARSGTMTRPHLCLYARKMREIINYAKTRKAVRPIIPFSANHEQMVKIWNAHQEFRTGEARLSANNGYDPTRRAGLRRYERLLVIATGNRSRAQPAASS